MRVWRATEYWLDRHDRNRLIVSEKGCGQDVNGINAQLYEKGWCRYGMHLCKLVGMWPSSIF